MYNGWKEYVVFAQHEYGDLPLATAFDGASVRAFARVDATMAGQGGTVAESLLTIGVLAHVRALASVGALMHGQCRALDE